MRMSDSIDDFPPVNEPDNDRKRHRRHAMATLVEILVDVSSGLGDPEDAKHRAAITQLTTVIGDMTGRIARADDRGVAAIMTEAATLVRGLQHREAKLTRATVH